jgi:hypothetical protein
LTALRVQHETKRETYDAFVRFQVLTAEIIKFTVFWDVASCSLVGADGRFRGEYCLHHQDDSLIFIVLMMEAIRTSETSVYFKTTRCYIPEDSKLYDTSVYCPRVYVGLSTLVAGWVSIMQG